MLKNTTRYFVGKFQNFVPPVPPDSILDDSAGKLSRDLEDELGLLPCRYHFTVVLYRPTNLSPGR
jgi:hypothetical protein